MADVGPVFDESGTLISVTGTTPPGARVERWPGHVIIGGFVNGHSHAFQRALRGRQEDAAPGGNFWSWRKDMYALVSRIQPAHMGVIATQAYAEMVRAGYTRVKEFHYLHHQPDGTPYDDVHEMSWRLIEAAERVGLAIELLRVVYLDTSEPAQARFSDRSLESAVQRTDDLRAAALTRGSVSAVGIAPHSVRAVTPDRIGECAAWARTMGVECHSHVAEQPREVDWCLETFGERPLDALASRGVCGPGFVGVHLTHLTTREIERVGEGAAGACICPTTEGNLGDGVPRLADLLAVGARLSIGSDSQAEINPFAELRLCEYNERNRLGRRGVLDPAGLLMSTTEPFVETSQPGWLLLNRADPALIGVGLDALPGAIVMGAGPSCISERHRAGTRLGDVVADSYPSVLMELFE